MKHILFVEDDRSLITGLSFVLQKQGYTVDVARTSLEAETLWQNGFYDLVILDVSLPDGSGYDLCRTIRRTSAVPVLFLSAADEETDVIMGLDIGGDDYITKPFKLAIFSPGSTHFSEGPGSSFPRWRRRFPLPASLSGSGSGRSSKTALRSV